MRNTKVRSLMLSTAAGLVAPIGALAADLPVRANLPVKIKAIDYVRICTPYGAGFYSIPGTDTCIRIGGGMRIDTSIHGGIYDTPYWQGGNNGAGSYNKEYFQTRSRFNLFVDTRSASDYGVIRTYANLSFDWTRGRENIAGGFVATNLVFIQFAGFTFGKAVSMFDPQWVFARPYISSGFLSSSNDVVGIPMLAYTATFDNGLSATLALEDAPPHHLAGVVNTSAPFLGPFSRAELNYGTTPSTFLGNAQLGDHAPDIVANLRLDQAWGSAHIAAAAHEVHGTYYTASSSDTGHPSATWGYAVTGAFELKNLPTGIGDSLKVEATFANGAAKYVFGGTWDTAGAGRFAVANGSTMLVGYALDGIYSGTSALNGTGILKSNAWDISAFYEHYWSPAWRTSVFGSYTAISYGSAGDAALLNAFNVLLTPQNVAAGTALGGSFNLGITQIGTRTAWTPVQDLTLSAEFIYTRLDQHLTGTINVANVPGYGGSPAFAVRDQNLYNGSVQIQRTF